MGVSVPSTQYIVELAHIFNVSTDYLLGVNTTSSISVAGLADKDIELVTFLKKCIIQAIRGNINSYPINSVVFFSSPA